MIFTDRTITVKNGNSSINEPIILYRGDKEVEIRFVLKEKAPFIFNKEVDSNIIELSEAAYGQLVIKTPNDLPAVFSEIAPTNEGKIVFTITAEMIDEITEVGNYTFQIRLLDESRNSRVTIPEVVNGIEIREPIATEDVSTSNEVNVATAGYALTTAGTTEDTFDTQGNYNKTTWTTGDRITAAKLNKIEAGIDGVNQKVASGSTGGETGVDLSIYQTKTDNTLNTTNKTVSGAINEINEAMVIAEEQTGDITVGEVPVGSSNKASDITITDTVGNYTSNNVEGALQEAGSQIKDNMNISNYVYPLEYFKGETHQEQINNAITFLNGKRATIQLRGTTYRFQDIVLPSNISILGEGNTIIKPVSSSSTPILRLFSNSSIKNLTIDDDGQTIKGIYFGYNGYGVTEKHNNIVVDNVTIKISNSNNDGLVIGYCENVKISNCTFENTNQTKSAVLIHSDDTNLTNKVIISDCIIKGFEKGLHSYGTGLRGYLNFNNNTIIGCGNGGIDMYHAFKSTVMNNIIDNCYIGIWGDTTGDNSVGQGNVISNNQIYNCSKYGIYAEEISVSSLNNNYIYKCGLGIYAGAGLKYTSFVNNNISFCEKGMLVSNEYVPEPMKSYLNQDCNLKGNTICYNEKEGVILKGLKGLWTIDSNEIFDNNTSNTPGVYALTIDDDPVANQSPQVVVMSNNRFHNLGRAVQGKEGHQQGVYIKCGECVIQNNYFNNETEDLKSHYSKPILMTNVFHTRVETPGGVPKSFGNIGHEEGEIMTSGDKGIRLSKAVDSLPSVGAGDEGRIVKIARTSESDELYYICKRKQNGSWQWEQIFV